MHRVLDLWIRLVSVLVPGAERGRWAEEWRGELDAMRRRGAGTARQLGWAWGVTRASVTFGIEDVTMGGWVREIRYAVRGLLRRPGFGVVAVLTIALGIGANTAIFSVIRGVLLSPLPYAEPGELVYINSAFPTMGFQEFWVSPPEYMELQERVRTLHGVGAYRENLFSIGGGEQPARVPGAVASAELFQVLGVIPETGRYYTPEEDVPGASVVVLSHELWTREFGGDPALVGRAIEVNGRTVDVLGVMPPGFDVNDEGVEIWVPLALDRANRENRASHYLNLVGRLAPGATVAQARDELREVVARWSDENPGVHTPSADLHPMALRPLQEEVVGEVRRPLVLLMGAVGLVLLIACANVANLLLARAEVRQKEISVRVALGAGRTQLLQQFLTEGMLLSLAGAVLGIAAAWAFVQALQGASPGDIPRLDEVGLDGTVLAFTGGVTFLTGILFGLAPARHMVGGGMGRALREGTGGTTAGGRRLRLRSLLVVTEMALALILVVGSGLLIRSFQALTEVDPGFDSDGLLTFELYLPPGTYPEPMDPVNFHRQLEEELRAIPGVTSVAAMEGLPPMRALDANDTEFEGLERTENEGPPHNVDYYQTVSAGYLETMGIQVVAGRGFRPSDGAGDILVAVVNETLARTFYPGESPIGRRLRPCCGDAIPWLEIVGVVEDVKQGGLDQPTGTELYFNQTQAALAGFPTRSMHVVVRAEVPPAGLAPAVRQAVWNLDGSLPVTRLRTMDTVLSEARARPRFLTQLLGLFGGLALALAAVGTYGVMSFSVEQRTREMGIRMALGAEVGRVRSLVLRDGLGVALVGLAVGVAGALGLSGVMESLLFGVEARDPITFIAVPVFLGLVAAAACWIPALRATRVDPVEVLREE
ncbi:MAG TPA: ABC transporter permease [Longimicrobiales bacterium]|nr:ABC transporter permease [Longimicrobiales bacterium]